MKTRKLILSLLLCGATAISAFAKKEPVLMTVDGKDVTVSEFEYLYNKNNSQQVEPQSLESYLDLFINYRLKVADALRAKADTSATFKAEFEKYRDDLARPYISDAEVAEKLRHEAYDHHLRDLTVSHIMVSRNDKQLIDSIYSVLKSGQGNFEDLASRLSIDEYSAKRGGFMGGVRAGILPYAFEEASFNTPVGEISEPVNSGFGWHIIRVEKSEPAKGEVNAAHILLLTRGLDNEAKAAAKEKIDSLYRVAASGADFADLARRFSQDPGSAARGGDLGWFGPGAMVQPFDSLSFSLPVGAVSEPFATDFGYHIIYKKDARGVAPFEDMVKTIDAEISRDYRANLPVKAALEALAKRNNSRLSNFAIISEALDTIASSTDESLVKSFADLTPAYTLAGKSVSVAEVLEANPMPKGLLPGEGRQMLENIIQNAYEKALFDIAVQDLEKNNDEYRNLLNEYRDGILLFDISNKKVWDRATNDEEGLKAYFEANRDKYTWEKPKFKSFIIFSSNDSVLAEIKAYTDSLGDRTFDREGLAKTLKDRFGQDVKVESVLAERGKNVITDYLGFGAAKPDVQSRRWPVYFAFRGKVIDAPEEVADVRGLVIADYQQQLEAAWLDELHKKYTVKINEKELKKLK